MATPTTPLRASGDVSIECSSNARPTMPKTLTTISSALADPQLLGAALGDPESWKVWIIIMKAADAEPLDPEELRIFQSISGDRDPPEHPVSELWILAGRRCGKTHMAGALAAHACTMVEHTLSPGERGRAITVAVSKDQAGACREYSRGFLKESEILRLSILDDSAEKITLEGGLEISAHASNFRSVRGATCVVAILDETAFWMDENAANPDKEIYRAIKPSLLTTQGRLIGISSPYRKTGLLWDKYSKSFGENDPNILVIQAPTRILNPTIPQSEIDIATQSDPEMARSEYYAEFRDDLADFLSREAVMSCVDDGIFERPPNFKSKYVAFTDPSGGRSDSMTMAIGHREGDTAILDLIREVKPKFNPEAVVAEFADACRAYRVSTIRGDRYAAEWTQSAFRKAGIHYKEISESKSELYTGILPAINAGAVRLLDSKTLINQLCSLERRTVRGGRRVDQVDHPKGAHDDVANAAAGVLAFIGGRRRGGSSGNGEYHHTPEVKLGYASSKKRYGESSRYQTQTARKPMKPLDKDAELYAEPTIELHPIGDAGHAIAKCDVGNDGRERWEIYDPHGTLLTKLWGKDNAERAVHELIETGAIVKGPR